MMVLAAVYEAEVVERGNDIYHVGVQLRHTSGQLKALRDNHFGMVAAVSLVKAVVSRQDVVLYIFYYFGRNRRFHITDCKNP